jgi:hypothetical protein
MPKVNTKREIILQASGAGILITLYGIKKKTAKWKFILEKDEGTMADFLLEEDEDLLPLQTRSRMRHHRGSQNR